MSHNILDYKDHLAEVHDKIQRLEQELADHKEARDSLIRETHRLDKEVERLRAALKKIITHPLMADTNLKIAKRALEDKK